MRAVRVRLGVTPPGRKGPSTINPSNMAGRVSGTLVLLEPSMESQLNVLEAVKFDRRDEG